MFGMEMLLSSLGIEPEKLQAQIAAVVSGATNADKRITQLQEDVADMKRTIDAIAVQLGVMSVATVPDQLMLLAPSGARHAGN